MVERDRQRTVPAHRMAGDRLALHVHRELRCHEVRQLLRHIGPHSEIGGPGLLGRIDVEAGAPPEIVAPVGPQLLQIVHRKMPSGRQPEH